MLSAVTIPLMRTTFFGQDLAWGELPVAANQIDWEIEDQVQVEVPKNLYVWPEQAGPPEAFMLCRATNHPKHFKVFQRAADVHEQEFIPTGMTFGQIWLKFHWERFVPHLPQILDSYPTSDLDSSGTREAIMRPAQEAI